MKCEWKKEIKNTWKWYENECECLAKTIKEVHLKINSKGMAP